MTLKITREFSCDGCGKVIPNTPSDEELQMPRWGWLYITAQYNTSKYPGMSEMEAYNYRSATVHFCPDCARDPKHILAVFAKLVGPKDERA